MKYEILTKNIASQAVNIVSTKLDALRCNSDLTTSVRAYDNGFIGVAGQIGNADINELKEKAIKNLSQNIPYPCIMTAGQKRHENHTNNTINRSELIKTTESLTNRLDKEFPNFVFDGKVQLNSRQHNYENSLGADYLYSNNTVSVELMMRDKRLVNIMDMAYGGESDHYNEDEIINDIANHVDAYDNKLELPKESLPVIISGSIAQHLISHIIAERFMSGATIFKDKLGKKLFSDKFNLIAARGYDSENTVPFFDDEGTTLSNDKFEFIKNGVLTGLLSTNRSAGMFNIPSSGTSESSFDSVPSFGLRGFKTPTTNPSLKNLVGKGIYICITSGGDMTPDGMLGLPVQLAFLYENGRLIGRLPEFSLSGSIYDVFGEKLKGVATSDFVKFSIDELLVTHLDIK